MSKQNIQDRSKCDNCYRAAKYGKPEWHNDCTKGRRFNKSTTNFSTGETTWSGWLVWTCDCDHERTTA
jgi:hypothetical protein